MLTLVTEASLYTEDRGSYDLLDLSTQILSVNKTHTRQCLYDVITGMLLEDQTRDAVV
jgi:hypothetical protein